MRSARSVMSSRLPMGVPTRYKQPKAFSSSVAARAFMHLSLARAAETICDACYTFLFGDRAEGFAVPLYEYKCVKCGRHTEKIEPVAGPHLKKCPHCGGKVESVITAPAIKFKGAGWYVTDYAGKTALGETPEKSDSSKGEKDGGGKSDSSDKADKKDSAAKESA